MTLEQKLKYMHNATEEDLNKAIESKYQKLEAIEVSPKHKYIRPSIYPLVFRNYLNSSKNEIQISGGIYDCGIYSYCVDNTCDIFKEFAQNVQKNKLDSINDVLKAVSQTIFEYVGGLEVQGNLSDRLSHLQNDEVGRLSSFKGSKNAWCMERAVMAHQIFSMLGMESELVISPIWLDEKKRKDGSMRTEQHAFNLIRHNGKTYLFDATLIDFSKSFEEQTSIVEVLPSETFDSLQNIPKRTLKGKDGRERSCVYNPQNIQPYITGESANDTMNESE